MVTRLELYNFVKLYRILEICRREHLEFRKEEEAKSILTMVDFVTVFKFQIQENVTLCAIFCFH